MVGEERNCQINANEYIMPIRKTTKEFINETKSIYGDEYSFDCTEYINNKTKVAVECKKHGIFYRNPLMLLRGYGCPYCTEKKHFYSYKEFTNLLQEKYGDLYTVTREDFYHKDEKQYVKFNCKLHGTFNTKPSLLLQVCCCKECKKENSIKELKEKIEEVYGNGYQVSQNKENHKKIDIRCNKHNTVNSLWKQHLLKNKFICNECYKEKQQLLNKEHFFKKATELYNGFYSYIGKYKTSQEYITAICPIHGEFKVTPNDHLNKHSGCPKCGNKLSNGENDIFDFCKSLDNNIVQRDKSVINPYELDIYIPNKKLAIEYNGLTWHSEQYKQNAKCYHLNKTNLCKGKSIKLIHIFEDEWLEKNDIVKSMIEREISEMETVIMVEECEIRKVSTKETTDFLEKNYIKGKHNSTYKYGLYYKNELLLLSTFKKKNRSNEYQLQCFCPKLFTRVVNGEEKLLDIFIKEVNPKRITVNVDKRFSNGSEFERLGFIKIGETQPNYYYCNRQHRENKSKYTKRKLVKQGFDDNKTEHKIMNERGFYRIYDCGEDVFELLIHI